MHVRVRFCGKPEAIVVVPSKLTKIDTFRKLLEDKFDVEPSLQRLFYGGKLLEDGYSFHDYNIKLNDVIQLMQKVTPLVFENGKQTEEEEEKDIKSETLGEKKIEYDDAVSKFYHVGDLIDIKDRFHSAWFEGKVLQIVKDPEYVSPNDCSNGTHSNEEHKPSTSRSPSKKTSQGSPKKKLQKNNKKDNFTTPNSKRKSPQKDADDKHSSSKCDTRPKSMKSLQSVNTAPKRSIKDYFSAKKKEDSPEGIDKKEEVPKNNESNGVSEVKDELIEKKEAKITNGNESFTYEEGLLYKVNFVDEDECSSQYCKLSEIRPRSRTEIEIEDLKVKQMVLLNYNPEQPHEKGFWFDYCIEEIVKLRKNTELIGTLYHGKDIPQNDVKVKCHDKIFAIETVIPLANRTEEYEKLMVTPTEKRAAPLACTKCRDNTKVPCRECGCYVCSGKNSPEETVLCDECNMGYHMTCLQPAMECLPSDEWYCPDCKRDPDSVVAPGAKKQAKKPNQGKSSRDWGRGMACVGKTQTCSMPANHFGPIPGIEVGMAWRFRIQLSESGVHRPPVSGIHGRDVEGAYSIVLSGGYEDDADHGFEFTYTGSGGRDLSGNKRTADQSSDQTLTRENKALARNCAVKEVKEEGADAGAKWRDGKPVRVVRSYKMLKHFPKYAPQDGIRYDGIYKIVKYYQETGKSGFKVWKYLVRRDDPNPAPWEEGGKTFPIVYPPGYQEAEAEKKTQKEREKLKKKPSSTVSTTTRVLWESNGNTDESESSTKADAHHNKKRISKKEADSSPPVKKMRTRPSVEQDTKDKNKPKSKAKTSMPKQIKDKSESKSPTMSTNPFTMAASSKKSKLSNRVADTPNGNVEPHVLSKEDKEAIRRDALNKKLWDECLEALEKGGKQGLINKMTTHFLCIICQEIAANPVTTSCSHNFCMSCLKLAFKSTESQGCPHCRSDLSKEELTNNDNLKSVLRAMLPGYDVRKK